MSTAVWILWASLVETTEPERLFLYGVAAGMVVALVVFMPLAALSKLASTPRDKAVAAAAEAKAKAKRARKAQHDDDDGDDDGPEDEQDSSVDEDEDVEDDDEGDGDDEEDDDDQYCKMVLLIRDDVGMTKGKAAAQCCHATLAAYETAVTKSAQTKSWVRSWKRNGQAKVTLKCPDEATMQVLGLRLSAATVADDVDDVDDDGRALLEMQAAARKIGLVARSICDAGRTQVEAGTRTVLAIGPGPIDLIDRVSGKLRLY
ncbi:hypothetical protein HK105_205796 [Polyrhizophydium stewartii]|uniref:peptidyl-tRNA hydrolase n=1 Tax=Polyrhizophydium stewartii TaxID=2732419 RepID=A0ABR4N568_9FUNG|nr:hypothetical protein HK105_007435 [Polyrhizophydium stewartii]